MAHAILAILLASAIATTLVGRRAKNAVPPQSETQKRVERRMLELADVNRHDLRY